MGNTLEAQLRQRAKLNIGDHELGVLDVLAYEPEDRSVGIMGSFLAVTGSDHNAYALHDDGTVHALDEEELEYADEPDGPGVGSWNSELLWPDYEPETV